MARLFVNYRSGDGDQSAALVERELSWRFGPQLTFHASRCDDAGDDARAVVLRAVRGSDAMVAIVGPCWLQARPDGTRAVDDPADRPRREIVEAMNNEVLVIPLLVAGAPRLDQATLPTELAPFAERHYLRLEHSQPDAGITRLVVRLTDAVAGLAIRHVIPAPARRL